MANIQTKYSVGDTVYFASTVSTRKKHDCPDCLGSTKWQVHSPAGGSFEVACPRCAASYQRDSDLSLDYTLYEPTAGRLTIGSIQVNTAPGAYDHGTRYMCVETGVGSGSIYNEDRLFETEEEALTAARALADEQNMTTEWVVQLYNKTLKLSDYQLDSAKLKLADEAKSRANSMLWNLGYLFDQIEEADSKDDILEHVQYYREYDWQRDKDKISDALSDQEGSEE